MRERHWPMPTNLNNLLSISSVESEAKRSFSKKNWTNKQMERRTEKSGQECRNQEIERKEDCQIREMKKGAHSETQTLG